MAFYDGDLVCGNGMTDAKLPAGMDWAEGKNVTFVHVPGTEIEKNKGHYENSFQADVVQDIVNRLRQHRDVVDDNIGIITPYRKQTTLLTSRVGKNLNFHCGCLPRI